MSEKIGFKLVTANTIIKGITNPGSKEVKGGNLGSQGSEGVFHAKLANQNNLR